MPRCAALMLAVLLARGAAVRAQDPGVGGRIRDTRADLSELQVELRSSEQALRRQSRQERDELGILERLNRELEVARRDARTHRHNMGLVLDRLRALAAAVAKLEDEEAADRSFLKEDLVGLYKAGASRQPFLPFAAPDGARWRIRTRYLEALADATSRRVDALSSDLGQLDSYRREFDARYAELRRSMLRVERTSRTVERERAGNERRLRRVRVGKANSERTVRELRAAADRLQGMLSMLQRAELRREEAEEEREAAEERRERAQEAAARSAQAGAGAGRAAPVVLRRVPGSRGRGLGRRLAWPVHGPLLSRFGKHLHPVFHVPVFNRGVEIGAAFGSPVRVVGAGTVDYAGPLEGFGQLVVVDHGRGLLSVYGYGSRLRVREGQVLRQGDVLEDVGRAPASGRPSLYFEIRKGAKAQDPLDYLARR